MEAKITKYTAELCGWVCQLSAEMLGERTLQEVRLRTLDWLGCVIGAKDASSALVMKNLADELGGAEVCTLLGSPQQTSVLNAVFSNAAMGHILECDDVNKASISHPGAAVIPAALAVAELLDADFEQYALGVTAGYEVVVRLGTALNPSLYDYWHTTSTCGVFAAAAAAGKIMGLSAACLERSMSLAGMMASGLVFGFGTDAKLVNVGHAAAAGVLAAMLADRGFSAPAAVLEAPNGYGAAVSDSRDFRILLPQPGDPFMISESYYKIHASCGHTHTALDAFLSLRQEYGFHADDIAHITVYAYQKAVDLVGQFRSDTEAHAKFSLPYCLAAAAVLGDVSLGSFREEVRSHPSISKLAEKIRVLEDAAFTLVYPEKRPERVCIVLKDGREISRTVELPNGKSPGLSFLKGKFIRLCTQTVSPANAESICQAVLAAVPETKIKNLTEQIRKELCFGKQHD